MKIIVIGLGNFGSSLALALTKLGNEVIGIDMDFQKTDQLKDQISSTICLDFADEKSMQNIPFDNADAIINSIGEDFGRSILISGLLKKAKIKNIYCRATSEMHRSILQTLGVEQIIMPDQDFARHLAKQITMPGIINTFTVSEEFLILEIKAPEKFFKMTFADIRIKNRYEIRLLMIKHAIETKNIFGMKSHNYEVFADSPSERTIYKDDILVLYGKFSNIQRIFSD
jgi:trk system potassium uptake protein TrkA